MDVLIDLLGQVGQHASACARARGQGPADAAVRGRAAGGAPFRSALSRAYTPHPLTQTETPLVSPSSAVWITGVGTCTPLVATPDQFTGHLLAGKPGIRRVSTFSVDEHPCQIAGQLTAVPCPEGTDLASFTRLHRLEQLMHYCCTQALRDAGLWEARSQLRIGLVLGVGAEWLELWEADGIEHGRLPGWQPIMSSDAVVERTCLRHEPGGAVDERLGGVRQRQLARLRRRGRGCGWAGWTSAWPVPATWR